MHGRLGALVWAGWDVASRYPLVFGICVSRAIRHGLWVRTCHSCL